MSTVAGPINEHVVLSIDKVVNKYSPLGMYPCDRKTCFGPAGSHAVYRSKHMDIKKLSQNNENLHPSLYQHIFHSKT